MYGGVLMQSWNQEWWDRDLNGFTQTDVIHNFRMSKQQRTTFNSTCRRLHKTLEVQTEFTLQNISPESDLGPGSDSL